MALARTYAIALAGVQGHVVEIEADIENGLVGLQLIGLPDTALREARDRIRSAVINSGHDWPMRRITVGLSPASLPKRGSGFDVATAVSFLTLGLDGNLGTSLTRAPARARQRWLRAYAPTLSRLIG
jgi:magnesium chelatase family protein